MLRTARALSASLRFVLSACAPVMLGRTPTPAAPGVTEMSVSAGYPVGLTCLLPDGTDLFGPEPAYWPLPLPPGFQIAYGRSETLETNFSLMVAPGLSGAVGTGVGYAPANVGARYGVKNRFQEEPVELAFDYGGSLYLLNVGLDAGILAAVPLGAAKLYGGLCGFGVLPVSGGLGLLGGAVSLSVGGEVPLAGRPSVLLELTLLTNLYNNAPYPVYNPVSPSAYTPQPVGFSLVPALSVRF